MKRHTTSGTTDIAAIYEKLSLCIDPRPELNFSTHLDLLIAVVLSAQTTDRAVNHVTEQLWKHCRTVNDYIELGEERLAEICHSIGMYRQKSRHIIELCRRLQIEQSGVVPDDFDYLITLPGVGVKTANVVLNVGFGEPRIAVDTHIFRVANRCGIAVAATPEKVGEILMKKTPRRFLQNAHHYLLLHGRYCCTARKPHCGTCPISELCPSRNDYVS